MGKDGEFVTLRTPVVLKESGETVLNQLGKPTQRLL